MDYFDVGRISSDAASPFAGGRYGKMPPSSSNDRSRKNPEFPYAVTDTQNGKREVVNASFQECWR
jgi:hypothetical protein